LKNTAWAKSQWRFLHFLNPTLSQAEQLGINGLWIGFAGGSWSQGGGSGRQRQACSDKRTREDRTIKELTLLPGGNKLVEVKFPADSLLLSRDGGRQGSSDCIERVKFLFSESVQVEFLGHRAVLSNCSLFFVTVAVSDLKKVIMDSLSVAITQFGFDLFKELKETKDGNIFFSPLGISTAIGMLPLGTGGATASQLQKVGASFALQTQIYFWGTTI
jgi:hypothetical protein